MKVHVIILAGGVGSRMNLDYPKQFLVVNGKPIIVSTIEKFQRNNRIDGITVVCLKDWIEYMRKLVDKYDLNKVVSVIPGGKTGHDSTKIGVYSLKDKLNNDDMVVIHDAARPIVPQIIIDDMVQVAEKNGNACSSVQCRDTVIRTYNQKYGSEQIERSEIIRVQTPQAYKYELIRNLYEKADLDNRNDFVYANTMAIEYGTTIYFSKGFECNIKITTKEDIIFYKAMECLSEEEYES